MTIGIGALCEQGEALILAADTRASYKSTALGPNDETGKLFDLPHEFFASIAGKLSYCNGVVAQLTEDFRGLPIAFTLDEVRSALNHARFFERDWIASETMRQQFGVTLAHFQTKPLSPEIYRQCKAILDGTKVEASLIVSGFLKSNSFVLLRAMKGSPVEIENNYTAIGSGSSGARSALDSRGQNAGYSLERSLVHVAEALEAARVHDPHGVGPADDPIVITPAKFSRFSITSAKAKDLMHRFQNKNTQQIDDSQAVRDEIQKLIISYPTSTGA